MNKYLNRWIEASLVKDCREETATLSLFEHVFTIFGFLTILMSDQGTDFINSEIQTMLE
jgi:hypothetical protein